MIEIINQSDFYEFDQPFLEKILTEYTKRKVELVVTTGDKIAKLNAMHRNIPKPTDVLSFPLFGNSKKDPLGSVVINVEYVKEVAKELKHSVCDEFTLLFIHGMLHLLGYDHETDNGEMRKEEEKLIKKYNLPKSLIVRNSF